VKLLDFGCRALGIVSATVLLAACGQSQPPVAAPIAMQSASGGMQRPNPGAKSPVTLLYNFTGSPDGAEPMSGVLALTKRQAPAGPRLIGTTAMGGDSNNDGTVYGLTPNKKGPWTESVLYAFKGSSAGDGSGPADCENNPEKIRRNVTEVLVNTMGGGLYGEGALVELTSTSSGPWTESFIYSFGGPPDGANPHGKLLVDKKGNVYGTTTAGSLYGAGTVYRMQPKGSSYSESVLYNFQGGTDGANPYSGLIADNEGALYGTTTDGGYTGSGTVFKLTPAGSRYKESVLYAFQGAPYDGAAPYGGLTASTGADLAADGKVVGMTSSGGNQGDGVAYELVPTGSSGYQESILWNFGSTSGDGAYPFGDVLINKTGLLLGATFAGGSAGSSGLGTFFTLAPSGSTYKETVYSFTESTGSNP
jgi:uncharacterized repeat protein (TIGR03803 family)